MIIHSGTMPSKGLGIHRYLMVQKETNKDFNESNRERKKRSLNWKNNGKYLAVGFTLSGASL